MADKYWENEKPVLTTTEHIEVRDFKNAGRVQIYGRYEADDGKAFTSTHVVLNSGRIFAEESMIFLGALYDALFGEVNGKPLYEIYEPGSPKYECAKYLYEAAQISLNGFERPETETSVSDEELSKILDSDFYDEGEEHSEPEPDEQEQNQPDDAYEGKHICYEPGDFYIDDNHPELNKIPFYNPLPEPKRGKGTPEYQFNETCIDDAIDDILTLVDYMYASLYRRGKDKGKINPAKFSDCCIEWVGNFAADKRLSDRLDHFCSDMLSDFKNDDISEIDILPLIGYNRMAEFTRIIDELYDS